MAHFAKIAQVVFMRLKFRRLENAKRIALEISQNKKPKLGFIDRLHYWNAKYVHCGCFKSYFRVNLNPNKKVVLTLFEIYMYMTTSGTFLNYVTTAIFGFMGGVIISYIYFTLCAVILDLSTWSAFYITAFLCAFLTLGMAFFETVRCVVLSILPEMCTSRARAMLISFALLLLITGPGSNILFNCKQLTDTVACTHEQFSNLNHNLTELYKKPLRALRGGVVHLLQHLKPFINKLKNGLIYSKNAFVGLGLNIKSAFSWLKTVSISCQTKVGTPYELCTKKMDGMSKHCRVRGLLFLSLILCNPLHIFSIICVPLKIVDLLCSFKAFIKATLFSFLKKKIRELGTWIKTIFYVSVSFHHSWGFETNQTKTLKEVLVDVYHHQQNRMEFFLGIFSVMKLLLGTYITYVLLSAFIYRYRFMYQTRFDNRHINKFLIELDTRRAGVNRQTLFPLTGAEKAYYVSLTSIRLTTWERADFFRGSSLLFYSCIKVVFIFMIDVLLAWILTLLHDHGRIAFYFGNDRSITGSEGSGIFWTIYSFFNRMLEPFDLEFRFDTNPCLPSPIPPDWLTYERIIVTMGFAWLLAMFQPFGLRFRNYVLSHYYPEAARRRAVWLFNHILQTRGYFSSYVRRTLFTRGAIGLRTERPDPYKWLITKFPRLYFILPYRNLYKECMVCGYNNPKVRCVTPDCPGIYCKDCFASLNNVCVICNMRQDFKGMDISEEEDSDGDEKAVPLEASKSWWKFWIQVSRTEDIPLRMLEEAITTNQPPPTTTEEPTKPKDYFDEKWRREDWASLDDFELPMPDLSSWTRSQYQGAPIRSKSPTTPKT